MSSRTRPLHLRTMAPTVAPLPRTVGPAPVSQKATGADGRTLDRETAGAMSARFGHDFSSVRIHTDSRAAQSASDMGAYAFAVGQDILFGAGRYTPGSPEGERLLAHELTHVVQQARYGPGDPGRMSRRDDASEREANSLAPQAVQGRPIRVEAAPGAAVARAENSDGQPDRAAVLEQAAHVLSYEHFDPGGSRINPGKTKEERDQEEQRHAFAAAMLEKAGYDIETHVRVGDKDVEKAASPTVEGVEGFGMRTFMPRKDKDGHFQTGVAPIVGFRGTESGTDWYNDMSAQHVGADPFRENRALIGQQMAAAAQAGPVTVTGHSLGGEHAQQAAVAFPDLVGDVTTYQSPGVRRSEADKLDAENAARTTAGRPAITSEHYRAAGDIVPWAGEKLTRGTVTTYGSDIPSYRVDSAHKSLPVTTFESQAGAVPPLSGPGGSPAANPFAPGGGGPTFLAPKTVTTDQEYAASNGVPEVLRSGVGLGLGLYEESKWGVQKGRGLLSGVGGAFSDGFQWGGGKMGEVGDGLLGAGVGTAGWARGRAGEALGGTASAAGRAAGWLGGKADEAGTGVSGFVHDVAGAHSLGDGLDRVENGLGGAGKWAGRTGREALTGTANAAGQAAGWMNHTAHDAAAGTERAATQAFGWMGHTAAQAGQGISSAARQAGGWLGGVGTEIGHGISRAGDDLSGFGSALRNGAGHLMDALIPPAY